MHRKALILATVAAALAWSPPSGFGRPEGDWVGMPEAELLQLKGAPKSKAAAGDRAIYRWDDAVVTVAGGRVTGVQRLDPAKEKAGQERAAQTAKKLREQEAEAARVREAENRRIAEENARRNAEEDARRAEEARRAEQAEADRRKQDDSSMPKRYY